MSDSFKECDFRIIKNLLDIIDFTQSAIKKQESLLS